MTNAARASELHPNSGVAGVAGVATDASDCAGAEIPSHGEPHEAPHHSDRCGNQSGKQRTGCYELADSGVYYVNGDDERHWLATPIQVIAAARDADSKRWGRVFLVADRDGRKHCVQIPWRQFVGDGNEALRILADHGAEFAPSKKSRDRVLDYLQTAPVAARVEIVDTCGWHTLRSGETVFVLGDRVLGAAAERVLYEPETRQVAFTAAGTTDGWRTEVAAPCVGNSRLAFAVCVALAGPLLYATSDESGGFHVVGSSSCGKTTMLYVAASVWGGHDFMRRWRATDNAIDAQAAQHCDTVLLLDELSQVEPKFAGGVAYGLANGQGKARANRTGSAKPVLKWRLLFLSAGEIGLAQHMAEGGKRTRAGQETRLAEIPADAGAGLGAFDTLHDTQGASTFANRLKEATRQHYGHVGPAFVRLLLDERESWPDLLVTVKELGSRFAGDGADGQVQRVARRFALVAVAGELATKWNLTGWQQGTAIAAAQTCFNAWVATRGGKGNLEPKQVLAQVRAFLEQHGDARFTPWDGVSNHTDPERVTHRRAGFWREHDGGRWYYVLPETMRQEVLAGLNTRDAQRALLDAGVLHPDSDGKATRSERLPGFGKSTRCYVVKPGLWDASSE